MKLKSAVSIGIASIVVIIVATAVFNSQDPYENKIRVAYFPNVGHAVPIVGIENGIFSSDLGNKTLIETRIFDSGDSMSHWKNASTTATISRSI